ncbi:redoxin domain-containing protein [bacterium]|nr:redoxin domain-containing protein [bacterium]
MKMERQGLAAALLALTLSVSLGISGCGGGSESGETASSNAGSQSASVPSGSSAAAESSPAATPGTGTPETALPAASIGMAPGTDDPDDLADNESVEIVRPREGTPEWTILEITKLRLQPFPETDDVNELRKERRERNEQIAKLAHEVIALTHQDPGKEQVFNVAVHRLMEATWQLAMQGDSEAVTELYDYAASFYGRSPKSRAAADSHWFLASFANENAVRHGDTEPRWLSEFARQARLFAERFPEDQQRAIKLLNDAAQTCDAYGIRDEAVQCYAALRQKYPESAPAQQAVAALRRLELPGKTLDLGGPTMDGGFLSIADFNATPVLVVFWSTQAKPFVERSAEILSIVSKFEKQGLQVIGVNLDTDESAVDAFKEKSGMGWQNIFHAAPSRRGWNHPVATYYGVTTIPQFWTVDVKGQVVSMTGEITQLEAELERLFPPQKE